VEHLSRFWWSHEASQSQWATASDPALGVVSHRQCTVLNNWWYNQSLCDFMWFVLLESMNIKALTAISMMVALQLLLSFLRELCGFYFLHGYNLTPCYQGVMKVPIRTGQKTKQNHSLPLISYLLHILQIVMILFNLFGWSDRRSLDQLESQETWLENKVSLRVISTYSSLQISTKLQLLLPHLPLQPEHRPFNWAEWYY